MTPETCPLCNKPSELFCEYKDKLYFKCVECKGIFLNKQNRLNPSEEKGRYLLHNNDVDDPHYQKFVSPITSLIMQDFSKNDWGLDFGAGPGPVITKILTDHGFQIKAYDPFFQNEPELLIEGKYNYIACCEVMEHFYNPQESFSLLKNLLAKKGKLYCKTSLYDDSIDFANWYYKNDPTHVFFYQVETLHKIKQNIGFAEVNILENVIVLSN